MTFEEARAQFPVLERIAYLNAGTFGPLAARDGPTPCATSSSATSTEGRSGLPQFAARRWSCGRRSAPRLAALVGADPLQVR